MAVIYLLDTNACIHFLHGTHPALVERVLASGPRALTVSTISVAELHFGAARSSRSRANQERLRTFLRELSVLPFSIECAEVFGRIKSAQMKSGEVIADFDLAIASSAMAHACVLVTDDDAFGRIPDLAIENWTGRDRDAKPASRTKQRNPR